MTKRVKYTAIWKEPIKIVKESKLSFFYITFPASTLLFPPSQSSSILIFRLLNNFNFPSFLFVDPRMGNVLFNAKHRMSKQNTHTFTQWSRKLSISNLSDYYKTVASYLSGENEGSYTSSQTHRCIQISSALQSKTQGSTLTCCYKNN